MKNAKKVLAIIMAGMICLSFAACNKNKDIDDATKTETETTQDPEQKPETVNTKLLTITAGNKKTVSIGDSRDAVIKALGTPDNEMTYSLGYEGMTVYLDEKVNMLTVKEKGYKAYKNAEVGMSIDKYREKLEQSEYTVEEQKDIGFYRITILADENGNIVTPTNVQETYTFTVTSNNYGKESTITHIQIKELGV